jgi:hypothetical protein
VPGRFTLRIGQILVIRRSPCVLIVACRVRCVLASTVDGAIDGDVPIDVTGSVIIGEHVSQDAAPGAVRGIAAVASPYCLPGSGGRSRQAIPARYRYTIPSTMRQLFSNRRALLPAFESRSGSVRAHFSLVKTRSRCCVDTNPACQSEGLE